MPRQNRSGGLQQWGTDLAETGTTEVLPSHSFNRLPALQSLRQKVHHAPEALQLRHDTRSEQRLSLPFQPTMLRLATRSISASWRATQTSRS